MDLTEKYKIFIAFVRTENPGIEHFRLIWSFAIREEFNKSGIYINVAINEQVLACVDCTVGEKGYIVTAIRNTNQTPSQDDFYRALGNILFTVRRNLNNPYTLITSELIDVSFFPWAP